MVRLHSELWTGMVNLSYHPVEYLFHHLCNCLTMALVQVPTMGTALVPILVMAMAPVMIPSLDLALEPVLGMMMGCVQAREM